MGMVNDTINGRMDVARVRRAEKLSITLPGELAGEIRQLVPPGEISAFFAEAARDSLAQRRLKSAMEAGFGAWSLAAHPELATPEDSTSYVRSLRRADRGRLSPRS